MSPIFPGDVPFRPELPRNPIRHDVVLPLLWATWRWTGDPKYLEPFRDEGPKILEKLPFWRRAPKVSES